jgi:hypothetical protein
MEINAEGIVVTGKKEKSNPKKFSRDEITQIPGSFGDPIRSIETLPGVGVPSFFLGEFSVRGANTNANAYYLDNLPIGNPFHALGIHSVVHKSMVEEMEFHTGAYSSLYQNALGGVVSIHSPKIILKDSNTIELSLFSVSGSGARVSEDLQDYILVSGRVSTMNETYGGIGVLETGFNFPDYYDAQIKAKKSINSNHSLYFYTLVSEDRVSISPQSGDTNSEESNPILEGGEVALQRGFSTYALRWEYEKSKLKNQFSLIHFQPKEVADASLANLEIDAGTKSSYSSLRQDLEYKYSNKSKWELGSEIRYLDYSSSGLTSYSNRQRGLLPNPFAVFDREFKPSTIDSQYNDVYMTYYLQGEFITDWGIWQPGLRHEYLREVSKESITPRLRWDRTNDSREWNAFVKLGRMSRYPTEPLAGDFASSNQNLNFEKSDSVSLGFLYPFQKNWILQAEPFYQEFSDLIIRDESISQRFQNSEIGISRGVEVMVRKKSNSNKMSFYGWLSYTYSENLRRFPDSPRNDWYTSDVDIRHSLNLVGGLKMDENWRVGMRFHARTSFPITPIIGDDGGFSRNSFSGQRIYYPIYSEFENSSRLPAYHRLDLRIDRNFYYEWGVINTYLEILNLYGRNNFVEQNWNPASPALRETNPRGTLDIASFRLQNPGVTIPLINFGMEARF